MNSLFIPLIILWFLILSRGGHRRTVIEAFAALSYPPEQDREEEDEDHEPVAAVAHWEDEDGCQKERSCDVALRPVRKWERGGGRGLARVGGTGGWGTAHLLRKNWTARLSSLTPYAACSSGG